jgi:hypothetical protein
MGSRHLLLKLAKDTTEAGIYRYFENKHLLLTYIISWYWVDRIPDYLSNKNIKDPKLKLKR